MGDNLVSPIRVANWWVWPTAIHYPLRDWETSSSEHVQFASVNLPDSKQK